MFPEAIMKILEERYLLPGETPKEMFKRVADFLGVDEIQRKEFYDAMVKLEFLPNSPTLMNAGTLFPMLSACFVLPIEDSMVGIMETLTSSVMIQKMGGGVGVNYSPLRPKGSPVSTTGGTSSGPVSFMRMFDTAIDVVKQGSRRRGAMIGVMNYNHPDIAEFISCKEHEGSFANFNISVGLDKEVFKRDSFELSFGDTRYGSLDTEDFLNLIAYFAWKTGDPGVLFFDNINRNNPLPEPIQCTNPCGEVPLLPYECCVLGSINLTKFLDSDDFDFGELQRIVHTGVTFLDRIVDKQHYPLPQNEVIQKKHRRIGLGIMGWADVLAILGIDYDSKDAVRLAEKLMKFIHLESIKASEKLGQELGYCHVENVKRRNIAVNSIAPTGTISMIAGCSSSIEPHFAKSYKKVVLGGEVEYEYDVGDVKTALEIDAEWHVRMQAAFQKYTDNAVSKTVNMPRTATAEEVYDLIILAHDLGCKGLTVYRDGSKRSQVLRRPIERPEFLQGETFREQVKCGSLYVTANKLDDQLFEVFVNGGFADNCRNCFLNALARVISIAIRTGVDPRRIADTLQLQCSDGKSCAIAIGQVLRAVTSSDIKECRTGKCEL